MEHETSQYCDKTKWNNKSIFEYKLDQTSRIIMHARDDVFLPFLIITSSWTMGILINFFIFFEKTFMKAIKNWWYFNSTIKNSFE